MEESREKGSREKYVYPEVRVMGSLSELTQGFLTPLLPDTLALTGSV